MNYKGIDISEHQGLINIENIKNEIDFIIIRATYGLKEDIYAQRNINECNRLNIPYGIYCYSYALNKERGKQEAENIILFANRQDKKPNFICIDMEDADGYKERNGFPTNEELINICDFFCNEVEKSGYYANIYASLSWLNTKLKSNKLDRYDKWVAQWNNECNYNGKYSIWQYTRSLKLEGYNRLLDGNICYNDLCTKGYVDTVDNYVDKKTNYEIVLEVKQGLWGNGEERKKRLTESGYDYNLIQALVNKEYLLSYIVKKGDNLTIIANTFNTTIEQIVKDNNISNPNLIYVGQKLIIRRN